MRIDSWKIWIADTTLVCCIQPNHQIYPISYIYIFISDRCGLDPTQSSNSENIIFVPFGKCQCHATGIFSTGHRQFRMFPNAFIYQARGVFAAKIRSTFFWLCVCAVQSHNVRCERQCHFCSSTWTRRMFYFKLVLRTHLLIENFIQFQ